MTKNYDFRPVRRAPTQCAAHKPNALRADFSMRRAIFHEAFGGLPDVKIWHVIARWKDLGVYFPNQVEFFNLEFICLVKNQISQDLSKCAK